MNTNYFDTPDEAARNWASERGFDPADLLVIDVEFDGGWYQYSVGEQLVRSEVVGIVVIDVEKLVPTVTVRQTEAGRWWAASWSGYRRVTWVARTPNGGFLASSVKGYDDAVKGAVRVLKAEASERAAIDRWGNLVRLNTQAEVDLPDGAVPLHGTAVQAGSLLWVRAFGRWRRAVLVKLNRTTCTALWQSPSTGEWHLASYRVSSTYV